MKQNYKFFGAKMNKDVDERLVPENQYIDANNVRIVSGDGDDAGVVKKLKGTEELASLPLYASTLGVLEFKKILYIFYLNTVGNTVLYKYDIDTSVGSILMSTTLGNEASDAPFDMNIIDDEDVQGGNRLLLYWNDKRNQPQKVNLTKLESDISHYSDSSDLLVSKPSSLMPPTISGGNDGGVNTMKDKNFQFAYRWLYEDGERSPLTPYSGIDISKEDYNYDNWKYVQAISAVSATASIYGSINGGSSFGSAYSMTIDLNNTTYPFINLIDFASSGVLYNNYLGQTIIGFGSLYETSTGNQVYFVSGDTDGTILDWYYSSDEPSSETWNGVHVTKNGLHNYIFGSFNDGSDDYPIVRKVLNQDAPILYYGGDLTEYKGYTIEDVTTSADGDIIYMLIYLNSNFKLLESSDNGETFSSVYSYSMESGYYHKSKITCTPDGKYVYIANFKRVSDTKSYFEFHKSSNYGLEMKLVSTYETGNSKYVASLMDRVMKASISCSGDGRYVYAHTSTLDPSSGAPYDVWNNRVFASRNFGEKFEEVGNGTTVGDSKSSYIADVSCSTFGDQSAYTFGTYIYKSDDFAESFSGVDTGITGLYTAISPDSELIKGRDLLLNDYNYMNVTAETGDKHVEGIELYARERDGGNMMLIKKWDKEKDSISDDTTVTFTFKNDSFYQILSESEQNRLFDNVPIKADSQETVEDRLVFANYVDGRSLKKSDGSKLTPSVTLSLVSSAYSDGNYTTLKTGTIQSYGILYKDKQGRPYSVLPIGSITIPTWAEDTANQVHKARVQISHVAPPDAHTFSIVRKNPRFSYDVIYKFEDVETRNGRIYLLLPTDVNAEIGWDLTYVGDGISFSEVDTPLQIVEIVDNSSQAERLNLSEGKWIAINDSGIEGFTISDIVNSSDIFTSGCFYVNEQLSTERDVVYYETPYVYGVTDGVHDETDITLSDDFDTIIKSYPYREEYKMSDLIKLTTLGLPWLETDDLNEVRRYSSITWSDAYVYDSNYNGLSNFNTANRKTLPTKHGRINRIHYNYSNVFVLQDDIASTVYVNKNILFDAVGNANIQGSNQFLGVYDPINSLHGCTSPESFSAWGDMLFYADKKRGKVSIVTPQGMSLVSDDGMSAFFRDLLINEDGKIYSCYNPQIRCFMMALPSSGKTVIFRPSRGFSSFQDITLGIGDNDEYYAYTISNGYIYKHDSDSEQLNYLYGEQKDANITFSANRDGDVIKMFLAISQETNNPWDVLITNNEQSTSITDWEKRDSFYFSEIPMDESASDDSYDDTLATEGVGTLTNAGATTFTFNKVPAVVSPNDVMWAIISGTPTKIGTITSIDSNIITISTVLAAPSIGDYCYVRKSNYINGEVMRDYYAKIKLTHEGNGETELYAVNLEAKESKQ